MSDVVRSLWVTRVGLAAPVLMFAGAALAARPSAVTTAAFAVCAGVAVGGGVATARLASALTRGDQGDLLLRSGARVPVARWRQVNGWDRIAVWTTVGVVVGVVATFPTSRVQLVYGGVGGLVALISIALYVQLRRAGALLESHAAMTAGELDRAEQLLATLERVDNPAIRAGIAGQKATIAARRGRPDRAITLLEAGWTGALDDRAAQLASLRLGLGDAELARRYVEATPASGRYLTFLTALLRARLAVHDRRWDDALAAARTPCDVPAYYERQLAWVEAAALAGAGRAALASERAASLGGLASDPWLAAVDPLLHQLVSDAVAGRDPSGGPPVAARWAPNPPAPSPRGDDPFAAPSARPGGRRPRRGLGIVPAESVVVGIPLPRWMSAFRLVMAVTLAALGGLYTALLAVMTTFGRPAERYEVVLCAVVWLVGGTYGLFAAAERSPGPAAVRSDGRKIGRRWFPLVSLGSTVPAVAVVGVAAALVPTAASPWLALGLAPFVALVAWSGWSRWRVLKLIRAVHFAPVTEAAAQARAFRPGALLQGSAMAQWTALAVLWSGEIAEAEQILDRMLLEQPWFDGLKNWFRAGRGELDLERALAEPEPEELGERYRWAVTVAVAALRAGRADRVRTRVPGWYELSDRLPNRFGALLLHLARRVDGVAPPADPELEWVERWVRPA